MFIFIEAFGLLLQSLFPQNKCYFILIPIFFQYVIFIFKSNLNKFYVKLLKERKVYNIKKMNLNQH